MDTTHRHTSTKNICILYMHTQRLKVIHSLNELIFSSYTNLFISKFKITVFFHQLLDVQYASGRWYLDGAQSSCHTSTFGIMIPEEETEQIKVSLECVF